MIALLSAILTILGPLLAAGVTAWLANKQKDSIHATVDEADDAIQHYTQGDQAALTALSRQLERLSREAKRKTGHS